MHRRFPLLVVPRRRWLLGIALVWNVVAHGWTLLVLLGAAGVLGNAVFVAETDALVMLALDGIGLLLLVGAGIVLLC